MRVKLYLLFIVFFVQFPTVHLSKSEWHYKIFNNSMFNALYICSPLSTHKHKCHQRKTYLHSHTYTVHSAHCKLYAIDKVYHICVDMPPKQHAFVRSKCSNIFLWRTLLFEFNFIALVPLLFVCLTIAL